MSYFGNFNNLIYDFTVNSDSEKQQYAVMDLTTRISTYGSPKDFEQLYAQYQIEEFQTPEIISYKLYGKFDYHWTILYVNQITNMETDWPLNAINLSQYCIEKYGQSEVNSIHHYRSLSTGITGTPDDLLFLQTQYGGADILPVTNFDYETELNESKRTIRVIKPNYIGTFAKEFIKGLTQ